MYRRERLEQVEVRHLVNSERSVVKTSDQDLRVFVECGASYERPRLRRVATFVVVEPEIVARHSMLVPLRWNMLGRRQWASTPEFGVLMEVCGVAQWLERRSVAGGLSMIYARSMVDM